MTEVVKLPYEYDLKIKQGADWSLTLTVSDANDNPKNLTGYTAKMQIREDFDSPVLLTLTNTSGITITAATGQVGVVLTAAQTTALPYTKLRYDIYISSSGGATTTYLLEGYIELRRRVTR